MIEKSQQVLLEAIRFSLIGVKPNYPADTDWDAVIKEAKAQTVMGLISPVIPVHDESSEQGKAAYMRILYEQDKLLQLLDTNNIPCVILKGCAAAVYYPKPYLRSMGDVDLLVQHDKFHEAERLLEANGYIYTHGKNYIEKGQTEPRHIGYEKNGIEFELHHHFSSSGFDMDDILEEAIARREYHSLNGYSVPILPEIENGLVLLGHINQHLKSNNLGLRQMIDWEMYLHSVMDKTKWKEQFAPAAKELGLFTLAVNITKMCSKHLGLPAAIKADDDISDDTSDELMSILLANGNFGRKAVSSQTSYGGKIRSVVFAVKNQGFISFFQEVGLGTWELCKKYPVLKPFAFLYGMFRHFCRGVTAFFNKAEIKKNISDGKNIYSLYKKIGVRTEK